MYALDLKGALVSFELPVNPYPDLAKSHYAAASRVPLIQSPSLRVPRPVSNNTEPESHNSSLLPFSLIYMAFYQVELPPDIHPLPENINAYVSSFSFDLANLIALTSYTYTPSF